MKINQFRENQSLTIQKPYPISSPKCGRMDKKLKEYMLDNFDFSSLKKAGVYPKEMKFNDYVGQAERICHIFSLSSIYDYDKLGKGTRVHFSYADPKPGPHDIPPYRKFIEIIGEEYRKDREGRLVAFSKEIKHRLNDPD
jgi:hypothetical protein